jgi:hypothetical protein
MEQWQINKISDIVSNNIHKIYEYFDIDYKEKDKLCMSKCFIHGGDNKTALNVYHNGDYRFHYKCRTHGCEKIFGSSLISMVRGALSKAKYDWSTAGDKEVSFMESINFLCGLYSIDIDKFEKKESDNVDISNFHFSKLVSAFQEDIRPSGQIDPELYRRYVKIPSKYFIDRGYSEDILKKYEVGDSFRPGTQTFNRATVPIYDDNHEKIVGFTARSLFEKCSKCSSYHKDTGFCKPFSKWINTAGFNKEKFLYNYWYAKEHIVKSNYTAILVESPGNVWRLEEAGVKNSVGLLGVYIQKDQESLLNNIGTMNLVVCLDNDSAGDEGYEFIKKTYMSKYNIKKISIDPYDDIGSMPVLKVKEIFKEFVND